MLLAVHERLIDRYDVDRWHWQDDTPPLDICLGAILVQHTAWSNVERALAALRAARCFSLEAIASLPEDALARIVRPAGLPLTKARRLQAFSLLARAEGGLPALLSKPPLALRPLLLATPGIGPETADVILLYAARAPVTVPDAYTVRLCRRLGLGPERDGYDRWQAWLIALYRPAPPSAAPTTRRSPSTARRPIALALAAATASSPTAAPTPPASLRVFSL